MEVGGCSWDSYFNHSLTGKLIAPYMYFSQKISVKYASYATYVTEKWLQKRYPTKGVSINASNVYLDEFNNSVIDARLQRYKDTHPTVYTLGTIAAVDVRYKGQEYVIRAISKLKKKGILLKYYLVGGGDPSYLLSLASKLGVSQQVCTLGLMLHKDIWRWLDSIDIYIQPSKQEGLPRAMIEAMNRGCITIGSNTAGIPELIEDDLVFKNGNVDMICDILIKILKEQSHEKHITYAYNKSKEFEKSILQTKRESIFNKYKHLVLSANED